MQRQTRVVQDPSLAQGFTQLFEKQIPCFLINENNQGEADRPQDLRMFRLFGNTIKSNILKLEVTSQSEIGAFYAVHWDSKSLQALLEDNKLATITSQDKFIQFLKQTFAASLSELECSISTVAGTNSQVLLTFAQPVKNNLKTIINRKYTILKLKLKKVSEQIIKNSIAYRYQRMRLKEQALSLRLLETEHALSKTSPSLLLAIQKDIKKAMY